MNEQTKCPKCNKPQGESLAEEVDIGVGVQQHVYGYECPECGQLSCCPHCGVWDNHHQAWCSEALGN